MPQGDDGDGGGDGWGWERAARNVLPNLAFLGLYFLITAYGGDGWGNGPFGKRLTDDAVNWGLECVLKRLQLRCA